MTPPQTFAFEIYNPARKARYYAAVPLDEGGFGQVWSGVTDYGLSVAIKIIKPTSDVERDFASWFIEQDVYLKSLAHPHIITTFDQFMSAAGHFVIVMERAGGSLHSLVQDVGSLNPWVVCLIGTQIVSALHHVHALDVIHRDVTLQNILWFPNGSFKLADFGISRQLVTAEDLAKTFIGRKGFVPPELYMAGFSTAQSDLYQLGLVMLTLLMGTPPIPYDASWDDTKQLIMDGRPRQLADALVSEHGTLAETISKMLRRRQAYRYASAMDVWQALYQEAMRRQQLHELASWAAQQAPAQMPPWLMKE